MSKKSGPPGLPLSVILEKTAQKQLEKVRVDCTTCPFGLQCIGSNPEDDPPTQVGIPGLTTGYACNHCRSTAMCVEGPYKRVHYIWIDCKKQRFPTSISGKMHRCPLCSGSVVDLLTHFGAKTYRILPTVHARYSVAERLEKFMEVKNTPKGLNKGDSSGI